jgi:DNA-binding beta-propeller fold protein YncE
VAFAGPQSSIAVGAGLVWTLNGVAGTVTAIDQASKKVFGTFSVGQRPVDIVYGDGAFWVLTAGSQPAPGEQGHSAAPAVTRYDPRSHTATASVPLPLPDGTGFFYLRHRPGQHELAFGAGALWVVNAPTLNSSIYRIDPRRGRIVAEITALDAGTIVFAGGSLWSENLDEIPAEIDRIDPRSNTVVNRIHTPALGLSSFAVADGALWVPDFYTGTVWRVIPGPPQVVRAVPMSIGVTSIVFSNGASALATRVWFVPMKVGSAQIVFTISLPASSVCRQSRILPRLGRRITVAWVRFSASGRISSCRRNCRSTKR